MRCTALMCCLALAVACTTIGRPFDPAHVPDIENGVQTHEQIRAWFGEPAEMLPVTDTPSGAVERWWYTYTRSTAGITSESRWLVIDFDDDGVVCDHTYTEN